MLSVIRLARTFHSSLFFVTSLVALLLRSDPAHILAKDKGALTSCGLDAACLGRRAVYRVTLALVLFHTALAIAIAAARDKTAVHGGYLLYKFLGFVAILVGCFFLPGKSMEEFSQACRVLSMLFLLIQAVILIDFAYDWNESWVELERFKAILAVAFLLFALVISMVVCSFLWFGRGPHCGLYNFLISSGLILSVAMTVVGMSVEHGNVLSSMIISAQVCYQISGGLLATKHECNRLLTSDQAQTSTLIVGLLFTLASLTYAAARAAGSSQDFLGPKAEGGSGGSGGGGGGAVGLLGGAPSEATEPDPSATYSYAFFHVTFALAAMYMGMLLSSWGTYGADDGQGPTSSGTVDYSIKEGVIGLWIRVVSAWVTAGIYLWSLIAPLVLKDRVFGRG